ncbi:Conserved hypothetical protein [Shewanella piezotolerans WP3]|uniref:Fibronectin type-III domain-containing protein n=1 Tax=Shewanella piezotolerans (strain WP3 / JCM 13877) TaxID=225849 RepID=B8CMS0_SHEPW|nr:RHS repeat-associated core domain-containing protein [Shewanella piezotolerans]ACJ29460.1 Conserved hypothetical protein [Shewanella piezotolerans WP3]
MNGLKWIKRCLYAVALLLLTVSSLSFAGEQGNNGRPEGPGSCQPGRDEPGCDCQPGRGEPGCDEQERPPSTPRLMLASSDSDGTFTVSWSGQNPSIHYELHGESKAPLYSGRALSITRTKGNGSYSYKVRACNGRICSGYSAIQTIRVAIALPTPATPSLSLASSDPDGNYRVSWSAVANATRYQLSGESNSSLYSGSALSLARSQSAGSYSYKVRACNGSACSAYSPIKTIQVSGSLPSNYKVTYQHTDMLGTPVMETDAEGKVVSRSVYEPFGKRLGGEKAGIGYTGHLQDTDLGLTYMQARYYDPLIGRFYSNDPVNATGHIGRGNPVHGFNRYTYANNNPYKYVDPDGEFAFLIPLVGAVIGGYTAFNQAKSMGADNSEAMVAGVAGAFVGALSGGTIGTAAGFGVKIAAQQAVKQSVVKTASKVVGSGVSGGASGSLTQAVADASGDISNGEVPSVDMSKVIAKGIEGAAVGLAAGIPAAVAGPSIATDVVGTAIAVSMEKEINK